MARVEVVGGAVRSSHGSFHGFRSVVLALAMTASLAVGSIVLAAPAEARVNGGRLDSLSIGCGMLQDEADALLAEASQTPASSPRQAAISARLRQIAHDWHSLCQDVFGNIVDARTINTGALGIAAASGLTIDAGPASTGPKVLTAGKAPKLSTASR